MKGFIEEYGKIIVVIILTLLMLGFGQTGLAKPLQNSLLKSTGMITNAHNKFDEVTKEPEPVTPGAIVDIEGVKYIVLEQREGYQALVMTANSTVNRPFQPSSRSDGQNQNTYEGSYIDNYLENNWYNNLSSTMKAAIQTTSIKQASYTKSNNPDSKQETGYNGQVYNTISRRVFLPSVSEIGKAVDLKSSDKVKEFLNGTYIVTRDGYNAVGVECLGVYDNGDILGAEYAGFGLDMRPAFVIDISQVNYKVTGHKDYK